MTTTDAPLLLTSRLILVPTTLAISLPSYVDFYRGLISDGRVTGMNSGDHNPEPVSLEEGLEVLREKNQSTWALRGFGDFGAAELPARLKDRAPTEPGGYVELDTDALSADELQSLVWVGYACIRDATQRVLAQRDNYLKKHTEPPPNAVDGELPPWQEMVEIKYGFDPSQWGKGLATEVVQALHNWGTTRFGIRRYIGATLKSNVGSRRVLQKTGYVPNDKTLWWAYTEVADQWVFHVDK